MNPATSLNADLTDLADRHGVTWTAAAEPAPVRVLHLLPDLAIGGGQTIVLQHVRHADRRRFAVTVAHLFHNAEMAPSFAEAGAPPRQLSAGARGRDLVLAMAKLVRILRAGDVDIVHVHSGPDRKVGQIAALLAGVPVVGHLHSEWVHFGPRYPEGAGPLRRLRGRLMAGVRDGVERRTVRHYIAESTSVAELFAPLVHAPIAVLDQAIAADRFAEAVAGGARVRMRAELGIGEAVPVLLNVSRMVGGKGQLELVRALSALPPRWSHVPLVLVGDGDQRPAVEAEAACLGLTGRIHFLGNRFDIPELLAMADVFVFASETEGFGLAVLEAMGAGLPVVAFRLPALEEFAVDGVTATLVPLGDGPGLAAAVAAVLDDPALRASMGSEGRAVVERRFPADAVARSFAMVYETVVGDGDRQEGRHG